MVGKPTEYRHAYVGSVASLGLHKGVAQVKLAGVSVKLRGWPAWFMHRTYHLSRVPTFNRKVRVAADWTLALFFHREIVSLGALQNPHQEFALAIEARAATGREARPTKSTPAEEGTGREEAGRSPPAARIAPLSLLAWPP